jgi:PTH1 family peptidyl-tRNA hydrolase
MKLIVGLGNPGMEFDNTRHNIGFGLLDYIADKKKIEFSKSKFNAKYLEYNYNGEKILFIKPLSYMNLSGEVVSKFVNFYKINLQDILVIQDDLDMNFGKIKIVFNSSSGGHNGIKDIEKFLGSKKYARLKIGISNNKSIDTKDYVLGKFTFAERKVLDEVYEKLINVVDDFCNISLERLMSKYNKK